MLRLLLDEHLSPDIAEGLSRVEKGIVVFDLVNWKEGRLLSLPDELLLREAAADKLTLVTYDRKTIPPLLKIWAEAGSGHGGVIFIDNKTIPSSDVRGLIRALQKLFRETARWDWANRVCFLRK